MATTPPAWPARNVILGCGYLGTALARAMLAQGAAVTALIRNAARAGALRELGVAPVVVADVAGDDWHASLTAADAAVVYCVSPSGEGLEGYQHAFGAGLRSLVRWLEMSAAAGHAPARAVLFTSSTTVYPQTDGSWVDENSPAAPAQIGPAGTILRAAEQIVRELPARLAQQTWVLRLAGLYGPDRLHWRDALRAGQRSFPGAGPAWVNLVHRDDAVAAVRICLGAGSDVSGNIYNVVDDVPAQRSEILAALAQKLGFDPSGIRCDPEAPSARGRHRANAAGLTPNRRIANTRLKSLGWIPMYHSYDKGFVE
jgi:nucleoside-diphosphate-sugar epimerase